MGNPLIPCLWDVSSHVDCTEETNKEEVAEVHVGLQDPQT